MNESILNSGENIATSERETVIDEYGIERSKDIGRLEKSAEHMLPDILKNPILLSFFDLKNEDLPRMQQCAKFFEQLRWGLSPQVPPNEDIRMYRGLLDKLRACPITPPHFVVPDKNDPELFHFCLESRNERAAVREDGTYYLLYALENKDAEGEVASRINLLNQNAYFPRVKLITRGNSSYVGVEFIPHLNSVERGEDVSDFIATCNSMDFGPDTNVTNFTRADNQLKYFDRDLADWIIHPANHPFNKASLGKKDKNLTW